MAEDEKIMTVIRASVEWGQDYTLERVGRNTNLREVAEQIGCELRNDR